jgi:hypothetical protein
MVWHSVGWPCSTATLLKRRACLMRQTGVQWLTKYRLLRFSALESARFCSDPGR